jgi:hypothetical protein
MVLTLQFHAAAAPVAHTTPLRSGEKCYVMPRFDLEKWFWAHEKYGVTDVAMVPPVSPSPSPSLLTSTASARLERLCTNHSTSDHNHGNQQPSQRQIQPDSLQAWLRWSSTFGQAPSSTHARIARRQTFDASLGHDRDVLHRDTTPIPFVRHNWQRGRAGAEPGRQVGRRCWKGHHGLRYQGRDLRERPYCHPRVL